MVIEKLKFVPFAVITLLMPVSAHAHLGHLGDLAGHSHWAGIALAGCAAALGGLLAAKGGGSSGAAEGDDTHNADNGDVTEDIIKGTGEEAHA